MRAVLSIKFLDENLDPDLITQSLGIQPTCRRKKGDKFPLKNKPEGEYKKGLWTWDLEIEGSNEVLNNAIQVMADNLLEALEKLSHQQACEFAWIDFYLMVNESEKIDGNVSFGLSPHSISLLQKTGLPIDITVSVSAEE